MDPDQPTAVDRPPGDDSAEDYSYDLAHEVPQARPAETSRQRARETRAAERPVDPDGDYSYDLAHEVPPQAG